jgi:uncharacterized membrane protein YhaH (DUF805 family)
MAMAIAAWLCLMGIISALYGHKTAMALASETWTATVNPLGRINMKKMMMTVLIHAAAMAVIVLMAVAAIAMSKYTQDWIGGDQAIHTIVWLCLVYGVVRTVVAWAEDDDK